MRRANQEGQQHRPGDVEPFRFDEDRKPDGHITTDGRTLPDGQAPRALSQTASRLLDVEALLAENDGLRQRLASQPVIEQAKGVLMSHYGINDDAAFQILRRWSQESNIKLRRVAQLLTDLAMTGQLVRQAPHELMQGAMQSPPSSCTAVATFSARSTD